jgi:hypothetical protein
MECSEKLKRGSADIGIVLSKARDIGETFVLESTFSSVNLSAKSRRELLDQLSESKLEVTVDTANILENLFSKAKEEILLLLARDAFKRFQFTREYSEAILMCPSGDFSMTNANETLPSAESWCSWISTMFRSNRPDVKPLLLNQSLA